MGLEPKIKGRLDRQQSKPGLAPGRRRCAREQWPPRAAAKLDAWMAGAVWNPEMSSRN
jgi:hypothetical protein